MQRQSSDLKAAAPVAATATETSRLLGDVQSTKPLELVLDPFTGFPDALVSQMSSLLNAPAARFSLALLLPLLLLGSTLTPPALAVEPSVALKQRTQEQINESYANKDGQDLSMSDLQGATFMEASLRGTDFHGSDLRGAMFTKAVLYRANLSGADLSDALIDRAVLNGADLSNAVLRGAWMALTDLGGTDITGADFTDAIIDKFQLKQLCSRAEGVNPTTGADTAESLRCATTRFYSGSGSK